MQHSGDTWRPPGEPHSEASFGHAAGSPEHSPGTGTPADHRSFYPSAAYPHHHDHEHRHHFHAQQQQQQQQEHMQMRAAQQAQQAQQNYQQYAQGDEHQTALRRPQPAASAFGSEQTRGRMAATAGDGWSPLGPTLPANAMPVALLPTLEQLHISPPRARSGAGGAPEPAGLEGRGLTSLADLQTALDPQAAAARAAAAFGSAAPSATNGHVVMHQGVLWGDVVMQCAEGDSQAEELTFLVARTHLDNPMEIADQGGMSYIS